MTKFLIKEGTEVLAINYTDNNKPSIAPKIIKKDVVYDSKRVQVDPVGKLGAHKESLSLGGQFARDGFYGFYLPENDDNYTTMLVHMNDVVTNVERGWYLFFCCNEVTFKCLFDN